MMKRLVLTIALAGVSGGAFAADLRGPIIEAPPPLPAPVAGFTWTGGYAGVNVGVGTADANYHSVYNSAGSVGGTTPNNFSCPNPVLNGDNSVSCTSYITTADVPSSSASASEHHRSGGALGGVQVGYNYALGSGGFGGLGGFGAVPVIGVEADFDGSGVASNGTLGGFASGALTGNPLYVSAATDIKYFGTVRGRLGVAFDRLFVFGTGGFAYADTSSYLTSPSTGISASSNNFHTGIAYGGGVEFALTNNLLLRAEYLHLDLNKKSIVHGNTGYATYDVYEKPTLDLVRAGLSYKFDFARTIAQPVIARY